MSGKPGFHLLQFIPEALPTFRADVAVLFGKYLPRHHVTSHVAGRRGDDLAAPAQFSAADMPRPARSRWRQELAYLAMVLRLMARASRQRYDMVQVRDMVSIGLLVMLLARVRGIPFAYWMSFPMCEGRIARARAGLHQRRRLRDMLLLAKGLAEDAILYKIVLPAACHVFVQSDAMGQAVAARGIAPSKLTAVPMGVDTELLDTRAAAVRAPAAGHAPLIAYLGTLDRLRELHVVVDALDIVRRAFPAARLLLIGDSPTPGDVDDLRGHAARAGLADAVEMTGWLPVEQAWARLRSADLAVSYIPRGILFDVSSPTKLLEYLALAMPCVGNDIPDQAHVLTASGAGVLARSSAPGIAEAICAILSDLPGARAAAAAGPAYIERERSYRVLAERLARCYMGLR